jgi:hypothetical protein
VRLSLPDADNVLRALRCVARLVRAAKGGRIMNARGFEWRDVVYCEFCNPARRLERACAGAVVRRAGGERGICAECLRSVQAMGFADVRGAECACGSALRSRHALRQELASAIEDHLSAPTSASAYALLRVSVLLQQCEACATALIESTAVELVGMLEPKGTV